MEVQVVQAPRGADTTSESQHLVNSSERICSQTLCRGRCEAVHRAGTPQLGKGSRSHEGRCWGGGEANTGVCHVMSLTKAREMHQLTEEIAPERTAVGHKRRPRLALLNWVCDDGESQFITYQLVWGWQISWDSQTEQPTLEELWWDLRESGKQATQRQMKCSACKTGVIPFREAHSDFDLDTLQDFPFTGLFQKKDSSVKTSAQCPAAVKKITRKVFWKEY